MPLQVSDFYERLCAKYDRAIASGDVVFLDSGPEASVVQQLAGSSLVKVLFRLLPSLLHRPEHGTVSEDPFLKEEPELTVLDEYGTDNELKVIFNRYPVVPRHFLLVTRAFVSQNSPLSGSELLATYSLLQDLRAKDTANRWFAFYNCGPQSGALQPHKHVQFMAPHPLFESYADQLASTLEPFTPTAQREPLQNKDLPFAHFLARLPDDAAGVDEELLVMCFASLLQRCLTVLRNADASHISFNAIVSTRYMMLVPRSQSKFQDVGVNSCGMLGLYMFKSQELLDEVQSAGPLAVMAACGFPSTAGQLTNEYDY